VLDSAVVIASVGSQAPDGRQATSTGASEHPEDARWHVLHERPENSDSQLASPSRLAQ